MLMDDSDQDFSFLCSRLLKRVRRKGGESGDEKKTVVQDEGEEEEGGGGGEGEDSGSQIQSRSKAPCKRKREKKSVLLHFFERKSTDKIHTDGGSEAAVGGGGGEQKKVRAKEKVLSRMQRFKRATPPRLVHTDVEASAESSVQPPRHSHFPRKGLLRSRNATSSWLRGYSRS
ncbi:hypothetical protein PHYPO_G00148400 [Pangasianodon hypophthalmus]|uniref:Uncharacterized protein n=1 Tax=Pangasianodon hypophthalmus TaxID=310915 RepID=A0A5N5KD03_PANHP|nr:hypothetical protein PHYPO_G00148400 [Pangasianodon hypophthalmus]